MTTLMPQRELGRTGIQVSPIGIGTWQLSGASGFHGLFWGDVAQDETEAIVRASVAGGVNWFDTAEIYGSGRSEESLARAIEAVGEAAAHVHVATKWWPVMRFAGSIRTTIGERQRRLHGLPIALYQIHQPVSLSSVEAEMDAMADLVAEGKIRSVGVSNFPARMMRRAHARLAKRGIPLASNQVKYSLVDRRIERNGVLAAARELGITVIAYSPLEQGLLTGKLHKDPVALGKLPLGRRVRIKPVFERSRPLVAELERVAAARGVTAAQVALAWTVTFHGDVVVAIPGASRGSQAEQNAAALAVRLDRAELDSIDRASRA